MPQTAHRHTVSLTVDVDLPYLLHVPDGAAPAGGWPLVLFLHGSGERGDDAEQLRRQGLPKRLEEGLAIPAIVLSPQCPEGDVWPQHFPALLHLLDAVAAQHGADPRRVVATGLSLGGAGTVHLVAAHPERFAALAPICGPWTSYYANPALARLPLWAFHGDADPVVSVDDSRRLIARVRELGGEPRYTEYPGVGHDAWTPAYADPEVLDWLLDQRRP
jgi:predicted peptidase